MVVRADSRVGNDEFEFAPRKSDLLSRLRQWFEKVMATWLRCCLNSTDCSVLLRLSPISFRQPYWTEIIFVLFEFESFIFFHSFLRQKICIFPTLINYELGCPRTSNFSSFLHIVLCLKWLKEFNIPPSLKIVWFGSCRKDANPVPRETLIGSQRLF